MPRPKNPLTVAALKAKTVLVKGCWLWTAGRDRDGYGTYKQAGYPYRAHRVMAHLTLKNPLKGGMCVCHTCDLPACVNPKHLFLSTHAGNMADAKAKGRTCRGQKQHLAKLYPEQVREIRNLLKEGLAKTTIAQKFGVHRRAIYAIRVSSSWGWLP